MLLYESLTGRLPFQGETSIDILYAILRSPYTPLRTLVPEIDPEWETLIDRCLAKSPGQRWASMEEILKSFEQWSAPGHIATPLQRPDKSIAVLYFANLSTNKEDEYFRDGMTEDIITELTKIKQLQLLPRSAVLAFRDKPLPVVQIGQQLAVAYVLDGSLRRAGNRLRITAQLAETRTGHSVWAERYDRQLEDVFAIQDEIAQNIARALRVMLTDREVREIEKVPTRDVQAYDYCLRARQVFYQFRRKSLEYARQMFARAIVLDPAYAGAFAGFADCCSFLYMYIEATQDNLREAVIASRRAVELDPESAEARASRGLAESLSKNYPEAEKEFEEAIRLNPRLYEAFYFYGRSCFAQGNMEKAADLFRAASKLDPADYQALVQLENCLRSLGRMQEARDVGEVALRVVERHVEVHPNDSRALYLGAGASLSVGDRERALQWADRALAVDPEETAVLYNVACTYNLVGETDHALDLLEKAVHNGFGHKEWLENDPDFLALRDHPRFQALIQSLVRTYRIALIAFPVRRLAVPHLVRCVSRVTENRDVPISFAANAATALSQHSVSSADRIRCSISFPETDRCASPLYLSCAWLLLLGAALPLRAQAAAAQTPLLNCSGLPCVDVTAAGGRHLKMLIDTGNANSVLDRPIADAMGIRLQPVNGPDGKPYPGYASGTLAGLRIGDAALGRSRSARRQPEAIYR